MKKNIILFLSLMIVLGATSAFAGVYVEDFEDGFDATIWIPQGYYTVEGGVFNMIGGYDYDPSDENYDVIYSHVAFLNQNYESVYHIEADINVSSDQDQMVGLTCNLRDPEPGYDEQQISIFLRTSAGVADYFAIISILGDEIISSGENIGIGTADVWHHFSLTFHDDFVTIGIDGNELNLFEAYYYNPANYKEYACYVHGSTALPYDVKYMVDNLKVFTATGTSPNDIMDSVISAVDGWIESGELVGTGEGGSAERRLNIFENILGRAQNLFNNGNIIRACNQLRIASNTSDGQFPPPDLVEGDSVQDLQKMISILRTDIGCE